MANLEKRIAALETASAVGVEPRTILVTFAKPGQLETEIEALHTKEGQSWSRAKGETQQAFIDRATSEAQRSEWGVALLFDGGGAVA